MTALASFTHKYLSHSLQTDLDRINKASTRTSEHKLITLAQEGSVRARTLLFNSHIGHIAKYAKLYNVSTIPLDDIMSEATLGFYRAIDMIDLNTGSALTTVSKFWIRAFVNEAIGKNHLVNMSVKDKKAAGKALDSTNGNTNERAQPVIRHRYESLDAPTEDGKNKHESLCGSDDGGFGVHENTQQYLKLLNLLPENSRERTIVEMHCEGSNYKEIGEHLGLSRERIRVIFDNVMQRLSKQAKSQGLV